MEVQVLQTFKFMSFLGGLMLLIVMEAIFRERAKINSPLKRYGLHLSLAVFNTLLTRFTLVIALSFLIDFTHKNQLGLSYFLPRNQIFHILLTVLMFDCFNYWWHRINHLIPFFWRFHRVHHSDTEVDLSTSFRFHPGEYMLSFLYKGIAVLLWGPSLEAFIIFEILITLVSQIHHANIRFPNWIEAFMKYIIPTPTLHMGHHTVDKTTGNANYSTILIIWDRIFGTYRDPYKLPIDEPLGIPEHRDKVLNPKTLMLHPFE